jgi:hypothetical protein
MDAQAQFEAILNEYYRRLSADPKVRGILHRIEIGNADLTDTAVLSDRAADLLGEVFGAAVLDIPEDVREAVCEGLLRERYDSMNETLAAVQETLDEAQGIHLTPQKAPFPTERVQQIAHSLLDPNAKPETIRRRANKPVATVAKSFHDDYIRTNARVRNDLGFKCYLDRVAATGCCAWCTGIAGRYVYGDHPADIFRRHDNCSCTVTFENGRERQDVWSKRTWDAKDPKEIERVASRPAKLTQQQAEQLQENAVSRLTLAGERDIMREKSKKPITPITDAAIDRVPLVNISGYTEEQCAKIQALHRELLEESRKENGGNEVAYVLDSMLDGKKSFYGEDDKIDFGYLYGKNLVILHNHPRNSSYSFSDLVEFFGSDQVQTLTIVKNNGRVETLTKLSEYNTESAMKELFRKGSRAEKTGLDSEFRKAVDKFLNKYEESGVIEWIKN